MPLRSVFPCSGRPPEKDETVLFQDDRRIGMTGDADCDGPQSSEFLGGQRRDADRRGCVGFCARDRGVSAGEQLGADTSARNVHSSGAVILKINF